MKVTLSQNRWYGDQPVTIDVPDNWNTELVGVKGDELPVLDMDGLRQRIDRPYGTVPIRELAKDRKKVAVIFDDITRGTPTKDIVHIVLEELLEAGIEKDNIQFICALGMHAAESRMDFVKKLGEDVVREYRVYNHDAFIHLTEVGTTSAGTVVKVNAEMMTCDLKIGIGAMTPHPFNAFGGGSKIILPGVSAYETIVQNHRIETKKIAEEHLKTFDIMGNLDNKAMRSDIEEAALLAGLDYKIDAIVNTRSEIVDLFAGAPIEEYYAAAECAKILYMSHIDGKKDVCITNANFKLNEAVITKTVGEQLVKEGGDLVIVNHAEAGQVTHYLCGPWGAGTPGAMFRIPPRSPNIRKLIMFSPYEDYTSETFFAPRGTIIWAHTWEEVMGELSDRGAGTSAAVVRDGTIQYFR